MQSPEHLTKIAFSLMAVVVLAVVAAFVPISKETQTKQGLFSVDYVAPKTTNKDFGNQGVMDLLFFTLQPRKIIDPNAKVLRISRAIPDVETLRKKLAAEKKAAEEAAIPSSEDKKIILAENPAAQTLLEKIKTIAGQQYEIRVTAAKQQNSEGCLKIANLKAAETCSDEITFQKAVVEGKPEWCAEIQNLNLKKRCVDSF